MESTPSPVADPVSPSMSLGARMVNVFLAPGEVFEACARVRVSWMNWVGVSLVLSLIAVSVQWLLFTNPAILQEMRSVQDKALEEMVAQGRMKKEDAERGRQMMSEGPGLLMMRVAASIAAVVASWIVPFWWGLFLWVVGRWVFRADVSYGRGVEIAALAGLISGLGGLVGFFVILGTGRLHAGPHLGMLVAEFNPVNKGHLALASINLFGIWHLLVMVLGLARVIGRPFSPVLIVVGGVWLGYKALAVVAGLGQLAL